MHIVIIGNGISGITAARFVRKLSDHKITVISGESEHFFSRTALMYVYMGHMTRKDITPYEPWFWKKNRIDLRYGHVSGLRPDERIIDMADGNTVTYDRLIIASGSQSKTSSWPGIQLKGVQGLYSWQDLESMERSSDGLRQAVIVGGGLIGVEMAEMFRARDIGVTMLVRESGYFGNTLPAEEAQLVSREIERHGVALRLNTALSEIIGASDGHVKEVITNTGERIPCAFVGVTIGVTPRIEPFNAAVACERGILVDEELRTNVPGIFAAGDCAQVIKPHEGRRAIEPVWYTGRMMGEVAAYNACGFHVDYAPGIWFNSAKFFDVEYQVYGDIRSSLPDDQETIYWEHEGGKKSIRINFNNSDLAVTGFNLMGIRYRHEVCEKWIAQHTPVTEVLARLELANFDVEFSETYEQRMRDQYKRQYGTEIKPATSRNADAALKFIAG